MGKRVGEGTANTKTIVSPRGAAGGMLAGLARLNPCAEPPTVATIHPGKGGSHRLEWDDMLS